MVVLKTLQERFSIARVTITKPINGLYFVPSTCLRVSVWTQCKSKFRPYKIGMVLLLGCPGNNAAAYWIAELGWSHLWLNFRFFPLLLFFIFITLQPPFSLASPRTASLSGIACTNPSQQLPSPRGLLKIWTSLSCSPHELFCSRTLAIPTNRGRSETCKLSAKLRPLGLFLLSCCSEYKREGHCWYVISWRNYCRGFWTHQPRLDADSTY